MSEMFKVATQNYLSLSDNVIFSQLSKSIPETISQEVSINSAQIELEKNEYISDTKSFVCSICSDNIDAQMCIILSDCLHSFCKECISETIKSCNDIFVKCPFQDQIGGCGFTLKDYEIRKVSTEEEYLRYERRYFAAIERTCEDRTFHCQTIDCTGWCCLDDKLEGNFKVFHCPVCDCENCLFCNAIHNGMNCEQYLNKFILENASNNSVEASNQKKIFEELVELEYKKCVSNVDPFECPICLEIYYKGQGVVLHDCLHTFCRDCLGLTIKHCEEVEVRCPFNNGNYRCEAYLQDREVRALSSQDVYEMFLKRSVLVAEQNCSERSFHCKKPDCPGWCLLDNDESVNIFECPVCLSENCISCQDIHSQMNCASFQKQKLKNSLNVDSRATGLYLENLLESGRAMNCPKCNVIVEKVSGCDAIQCFMCKTHICWATKGPRWGPNGIGDKSGGCKCGLNGKLCTPNCQNCH